MCEKTLKKIEEEYHKLVEVQEHINSLYKEITLENYDNNKIQIREELRYEQVILRNITLELNNLFHIQQKWYKPQFKITAGNILQVDLGDRYYIKPPLGLNRSSKEFTLLKKLLINLHKEYFLHGGRIGYAYTSTESHMWEIPNFTNDNDLIRTLRKEAKKP